MGPLGIVDLQPGLGDLAHLLEGVEEIGVEDLFAEAPIESFDEGVLIRLSRLDVADGNALRRAPVDKGFGREFGPVVDAHAGRPAVEPDEVVEDPDHTGTGDRRPDLDRQGLPIALVEHVEGPEAAAVVEGIRHEIQGPGLVEARRRHQRLAKAHRDPPLRAPGQIQPQGAVHAMHPLVVPPMPGPAEAIEAFPETPATVSRDHFVQRGDHGGVPDQPGARRPVVRRPREPHRLACPPHGHPVLLHQHGQDLSFRGRRHRFRLKTGSSAPSSPAFRPTGWRRGDGDRRDRAGGVVDLERQTLLLLQALTGMEEAARADYAAFRTALEKLHHGAAGCCRMTGSRLIVPTSARSVRLTTVQMT
jgi:hypothetical protein